MPYTQQQWHDDTTLTPYGPINAARLGHIEAGIYAAQATAESVAGLDASSYGAVGDGVTDDTAAIQAAIDAAAGDIPGFGGAEQGGTVFLSRGTFLVSSQIVVKNKVCLRGQGHSATIILADATFPTSTAIVRLGEATDPQGSYGSRLENLEVNANLVTGSIGIHSTTIQEHSGAFNVLVREFQSKGIYIDGFGCQNFEFRDIDIGSTGTPTHGIHFNSIAGANQVHRVTINTENNLTYGIRQDGGETINYSSIHLETCTSGIYLAGSYAATLVGVDAHNDVTNIINIDPGSGGSLTGSMIMNTGATKTIWDQPRGLSHAVDEAFFYISDVGTGSAGKGRYFSSGAMASYEILDAANNVVRFKNGGSPEGIFSAGPGSQCIDTGNGELYIKKTGTGNTGWKLVTHA